MAIRPMKKLSDIIKLKAEKVGSNAELGRLLGGIPGQAIGQYINSPDKMPSISFAFKWKEAFEENIIDLIFETKTSIGKSVGSRKEADLLDQLIKEKQLVIKLFEDLKKKDAIITDLKNKIENIQPK